MPRTITVAVPDIGDFEDVEVIELLVTSGDRVEAEDSLITLESDKATMEIPSPAAGVVGELRVRLGDLVSEGTPILTLEVADGEEARTPETATAPTEATIPDAATAPTGATVRDAVAGTADESAADLHAEVLVLGSGPGGYTAAFRAADLGKRVVLVERHAALGGVCLNVGCIPSKALLHVAEVMAAAGDLAESGVTFAEPRIDVEKLRARKDQVVGQLTKGLSSLARQRGVQTVTGLGRFAGPHRLEVETESGKQSISFDHAIVAAGSRSVELPGIPHDDPRVMDSTDALELREIPERLLVIGGGIIGLEMATVYDALGAEVTVVELLDRLLTGTDPDLVRPLEKRIRKRYADIWLGTRVTGIEPLAEGLRVRFEGKDAPESAVFDRVLVAVGRTPNGGSIGAEEAGLRVDERGFIPVDERQRTNVPHIYAIGDVAGPPLLAHKATHEGKTAAEVIAGLPAAFDAKTVPSVAYTDPEVAWMGLTESDAKDRGIAVKKASFPWSASGRALGIGRPEGLTKLLFSEADGRLVGAGIVGVHAGELLAEVVLALEMGADAEDIALTIHSHPTLSETVAFAAETAHGTITDLYLPARRPTR